MVYEDLSIDFGRRNKHPKSRYGVQTRLRALLEPAMSVSCSATSVDVVSMIETIVFKGAECTSGNVKRL